MAPARRPHHRWARNEARYSCYGVAVITRNTFAAARGFDYPAVDARKWYARGCKRVSLQIPFALANRSSALAAATLPLIRAAKASWARARRCFRSASGMDRFATAIESRVQRLLR